MSLLGFDWMAFVLSWFLCAQIGKFRTLSSCFLRKVVFVRPPGAEWLKFERQRRLSARFLQDGLKVQMHSGLHMLSCSDYVIAILPHFQQVEVLLQYLFVAVIVHLAVLGRWLLTGELSGQFVLVAAVLLPLGQMLGMFWKVGRLTLRSMRMARVAFLGLALMLATGARAFAADGLLFLLKSPVAGVRLFDIDLNGPADRLGNLLEPLRNHLRHPWLLHLPPFIVRWLVPLFAIVFTAMSVPVVGMAALKADHAKRVGLPSKQLAGICTALRPPYLVAAAAAVLPLIAPVLWVPSLTGDHLEGWLSPCGLEVVRHMALLAFALCRLGTLPSTLQFAMLENVRPPEGAESADAVAGATGSGAELQQLMVWFFHFMAFPAVVLLMGLHGLSTAGAAACRASEAPPLESVDAAVRVLSLFEGNSSAASNDGGGRRLREAFRELGSMIPPEVTWRSAQCLLVGMLFIGAVTELVATLIGRTDVFKLQAASKLGDEQCRTGSTIDDTQKLPDSNRGSMDGRTEISPKKED